MTASEYDAANIATVSSFNQLVIAIPVEKYKNKILHRPHGHTTLMIAQIVNSIRRFWETYAWKDWVSDFEGELNDLKKWIKDNANGLVDDQEKQLSNRLKGVRGQITRQLKKLNHL